MKITKIILLFLALLLASCSYNPQNEMFGHS